MENEPMPSVLAIFAHPDDIEFVAAGTLLRLKDAGWDTHTMNVANGCCGSVTTDRDETARLRLDESRRSAARLGARHYDPICNDLEVDYNPTNLAKIAAIVRIAKPTIVLTHAPLDYMEDHMQTCRLAVTAAFSRAVPNYATDPDTPVWEGDVAIYHAQPHGNRTPLGEWVTPSLVVPIDEVIERKLAMLSEHQSQQAWLQSSQGMNSYCQTMLDLGCEVAHSTGCSARYAEGWRPHLHLGFSAKPFDPLRQALLT
jgi:LmbE family N-acetylglucosaminyl deacetylase